MSRLIAIKTLTFFIISVCIITVARCQEPQILIGDSSFSPEQYYKVMEESNSQMSMEYYEIDAQFTVIDTKDYGDVALFNLKIDSVISIHPLKEFKKILEGEKDGESVLTIYYWKEDNKINIQKTSKCRMCLRSYRPINYVGHGECCTLFFNCLTGERIEICNADIKTILMEVIGNKKK